MACMTRHNLKKIKKKEKVHQNIQTYKPKRLLKEYVETKIDAREQKDGPNGGLKREIG